MSEIPIMPSEYKGDYTTNGGFTNTTPRKWTTQEIEWVKDLKQKGYSNEEIAESVGRSETSVAIKTKRMGKKNDTYNSGHLTDKYNLNQLFLVSVKPESVLDLYCGVKSFYSGYGGELVTNDIDNDIKADFHCDAHKLICYLYAQDRKFDIIDLDPFGSAYDCFDLAIKMAEKGLIITLGELGHKRWKRLDFVSRYYDIDNLEDFTIENLIKHIQKIGRRNKKELKIWYYKEWQNIGRVYFTIEKLKITEQWEGEKNETKI